MVRVSLPGIKLTGLHNTVKTVTKFCYTFKALTQFDPRPDKAHTSART
ncbi:MAG: hypothetical protein HA490_00990 [Archaeoglobales archaeon]|nr:hypothetical protein [Archaeoglobales archaeon]